MNDNTARSAGRVCFGVAVMGVGLLQLVTAQFMRLVPQLPAWVPGPTVMACVVGVVFLAIGLCILSGRMVPLAANALAAMILANLVLYAPQLVWNEVVDRPFFRGFMWTNPLKQLALVGGVAMLAALFPDGASVASWGVARLERSGPFLMAIFLIVCGVQHFVYAAFVAAMVPTWIPATQTFWVYFAGVALIAGGAGMLVRRSARLAANLSALMIFSWVFLVHIPRAVREPRHAFEASGIFEALALSGVALLVAATRGR